MADRNRDLWEGDHSSSGDDKNDNRTKRMRHNEFTCNLCQAIFDAGKFHGDDEEDKVILCDPCYKRTMWCCFCYKSVERNSVQSYRGPVCNQCLPGFQIPLITPWEEVASLLRSPANDWPGPRPAVVTVSSSIDCDIRFRQIALRFGFRAVDQSRLHNNYLPWVGNFKMLRVDNFRVLRFDNAPSLLFLAGAVVHTLVERRFINQATASSLLPIELHWVFSPSKQWQEPFFHEIAARGPSRATLDQYRKEISAERKRGRR